MPFFARPAHGIAILGFTATVLAVGVGCEPPNPENEAPFISLIDPAGSFDEALNLTVHPVFSNEDFEITVRFEDRLNTNGTVQATIGLDSTFAAAPDDLVDPVVLDAAPIDEDIAVELPTLDEGEIDLVIRANDGLGPVGVDEDGVAYDRGERVLRYRLQARDRVLPVFTPPDPTTEDDVTGQLPVTVVQAYYEWRWTLEGATAPVATDVGDQGTLSANNTERDQVWEYCVDRWLPDPNPTPRTDWPEPDLVACASVTIANTVPERPVVEITPDLPNATTPLYCEATSTDVDDDALTYTYSWTNGSISIEGQWLDPADTLAGETWFCEATASDGDLTSPPSNVDNAVTIRPAGFVTNSNLLQGASFTPRLPLQLIVQDVSSVGGASLPTVMVTGPNACLLHSFVNPADIAYQLTASTTGTLGRSLAAADIDQDGSMDAVIADEGAVYTAFANTLPNGGSGPAEGLASTSFVTGVADPAGFATRVAVGQLRDVSGDQGHLEIAATWATPGVENLIKVYDGDTIQPAGTPLDANTSVATITGPAANDTFGSLLLADGDFDGDGIDDLVVVDSGVATAGDTAVYVFKGGATLSGALAYTDADWTFTVDAAGVSAAVGAAAAYTDLDGDGMDELFIGAPGANSDTGAVYVLSSDGLTQSAHPLASSAMATHTGDLPGDRFGESLVAFAQASGGFAIEGVAIGAPGASGGNGAAFVGLGDAWMTSGAGADFSITGDAGAGLLPVAATDADQDGFTDLVVVQDGGIGNLTFWTLGSGQ